jgi:hypothetical protein
MEKYGINYFNFAVIVAIASYRIIRTIVGEGVLLFLTISNYYFFKISKLCFWAKTFIYDYTAKIGV